MKTLIVLCHPSNENFSRVIQSETSILYDKYKLEFEIRNLYQIGFNPIISSNDIAAYKMGTAQEDVLREQEYIRSADLIIFIYPIWWTGMPAMMKGYIDRVFSEGFAYSITTKGRKKLLKKKKVVIVSTAEQNSKPHHVSSSYEQIINAEKQIFESCGMDVILHHHVEDYMSLENQPQILKQKIDELKPEIKKLFLLKLNCQLNIPTMF